MKKFWGVLAAVVIGAGAVGCSGPARPMSALFGTGPQCDEADLERFSPEWARSLQGLGFEYYDYDLSDSEFTVDTDVLDVDLDSFEDAFGEGAGFVQGGGIMMSPENWNGEFQGRNGSHAILASLSPLTEIRLAQHGSLEAYEQEMRGKWGHELVGFDQVDATGWSWAAHSHVSSDGLETEDLTLASLGEGVIFRVQVMRLEINSGWAGDEEDSHEPIVAEQVQPVADQLLQAFCG